MCKFDKYSTISVCDELALSRAKMSNSLPPNGPSLSLERFSMTLSTISWRALDLVVAEKFITSLLFFAGKFVMRPIT
jgi:hypothetical protein